MALQNEFLILGSPLQLGFFSELTRGVFFNFDYPKPNAWSQVTPWEQASFPDFLLEASHPDHHHPRTTTSRTTQKYKSYNFLWEQKIPVSLLSLTKETWGDAWGEGAVGAVQQVWHGDGDHQDWKVRKTESKICRFPWLLYAVVLSFYNHSHCWNIREKNLEVMPMENVVTSFFKYDSLSCSGGARAMPQNYWCLGWWCTSTSSTLFIALWRHADP